MFALDNAFSGILSLFVGWFFVLPPIIRLCVRFAVALLIACIVWRTTSSPNSKWRRSGGTFALIFLVPFVLFALFDMNQQRSSARREMCKQASTLVVSTTSQIPVEGFLISADYEGIINGRFVENIGAHAGLGLLRGATFNEMAEVALLKWKYSFVEFEMKPRGKFDSLASLKYTNIGRLDPKGWSGERVS